MPARADPPRFVLQSSVTWADEAVLACHVSTSSLSAFLQLNDSLSDLSYKAVTFGVSLPWLLVGPLAPSGLLRVAANPFGFTPGSQVFSERTGFQLDASLPPGDLGLACMPIGDILGLYCRSIRGGPPEYGCFAGILTEGGYCAEGLVSFSSPPPGELGEEWFPSQAPWPGGTLMIAAGRLSAALQWLSMEAGACASFGERVEPGAAWHLQCSARTDQAYAALLFSRIEGHYREPGGVSPSEDCQLAFSAAVTPPEGSARLAYTLTVERPGFAVRPYRRSTEEIALTLERTLLKAGALQLLARVEAQKRNENDESGSREETASARLSFRGRARLLAATAGAGLTEGEGVGFFLSALLSCSGAFPRISFDARMDGVDGGRPRLTAGAGVKQEMQGATLSLDLGVDGLHAPDAASGWMDHLRMRATFTLRGTVIPDPPAAPPSPTPPPG